jgi:UDP-glucose 4-epimerase
MRIVIFGATGNVGTSLVELLAADGEVGEIVGVARRLPDWHPPKTRWVTADVADEGGDLRPVVAGADAVVHLAWLFQPSHDPVATWRANVLGSIRVFEAAAATGVPVLVHASSVGAYSPGPKDRAVDESWPTHGWPTAGYSREKAYVERVLDAFEAEHAEMRVVRLRPGFIFKRTSAAEQRRLFAGPLLPGFLVRPSLIPVIPRFAGFRLQALHSDDAAEAYRLALLRPVRGAFNLAAEPPLDAESLAGLLDARPVPVPPGLLRAGVALAWHLHLAPASPHLFDLAVRLPLLDSTRARDELGWSPRHSALDAVGEFLGGLNDAAGGATPPLATHAGGPGRLSEFASRMGSTPG